MDGRVNPDHQPNLSAGEISARLGIAPDAGYERGSLLNPRNPAKSARRETSVWILRSGLGDTADLADHVAALVQFANGHEPELARLSSDCELELFLGFGSESGQGGSTLPARLLAQVGALGFAITLDLYPHTAP